jgi:hypothetical protein
MNKNKRSLEQKRLPLNQEQRQTVVLKKQLSKQAIEELDRQLRIRARQKDESELVPEEQESFSGGNDEGSEEEREPNQASSVQPHPLNKRRRMSLSAGDGNRQELDETSISGAFALHTSLMDVY